MFRDITPLLAEPKAFAYAVDAICEMVGDTKVDAIAAVESRGFIFAAAMTEKIGAGFVPIRKKGKLPAETVSVRYELEYGQDCLEIHKDGLEKGDSVIIVDDLLATGGTVKAAAELVEKLGAVVAKTLFLIELTELAGREKIAKYPVHSLLKF